MNLPGFSASAALERAGGHYRNTGYASSRWAGVQLVPQQLDYCARHCPIWDAECFCTCAGTLRVESGTTQIYVCNNIAGVWVNGHARLDNLTVVEVALDVEVVASGAPDANIAMYFTPLRRRLS